MSPPIGIILAGGSGTRLRPLTNELNKHLLLVHDRPMIYWPLRTLARAGVQRVCIVTNARDIPMMRSAVAKPADHGLDAIEFAPQGEAIGVAAALASAKEQCKEWGGRWGGEWGGDSCFVLLGDNIFEDDLPAVSTPGAHIFLKLVDDTSQLAAAQIEGDRVTSIAEKPEPPAPGLAVTGAYLYDKTVFDRIRTLTPSPRGELEITALNQAYLRDNQLSHSVIEGRWEDAGTHEGLARAARLAASIKH